MNVEKLVPVDSRIFHVDSTDINIFRFFIKNLF